MNRTVFTILGGTVVSILLSSASLAQEVKPKNAQAWELTARVQLQYLVNTDTEGDAAKTTNGFRLRRGRLQVKGKLTNHVDTKFQIEVRDNSPRLKDAEGKLEFAHGLFLRMGQFKVPVWREELRSSGKLLLVERSEAAGFLLDHRLSARHVGVEFGGNLASGIQFAVNVSNGAGEGGREDAGRTKDSQFVNNGKLISGRFNLPIAEQFQIGVAGAVNNVGAKIDTTNNTGTITVLAPDFGIYLTTGANQRLDLEGGFAVGSISSDFLGTQDNQRFTLFEVSGRWMTKLNAANESLAGLDAFELAGGVTFVEPNRDLDNDESLFLRFGPAIYFGKQTRIQVNGEIELPGAEGADSILEFRAQATYNF